MTADRVAQLYRLYGPSIYARCQRVLGDGAAAEDATQETFMRVLRQLEKAPDTRTGLRYIYRVATHYCLNQLRDARLRPEPLAELPDLPTGINVERALLERDFAVRLMARLPEKLRAIVWLHYVDGLDQGEVARTLDVSRRTVVNRLADFHERVERFSRKDLT
ncbi:sigma-70 family RNA polymerase sigma factor [Myxococcaceae bacterium JPH2]|nr:sigma-70 family RNA polymerase sigma factor [Myxococcaceae bacterium JPH2]